MKFQIHQQNENMGNGSPLFFFPQMIFRFVHTYINASMGCYNELDSPFAKMSPRLSQSGNSFSNLNLNVMPSLVWQEHPWGCKTMGDAQQRQYRGSQKPGKNSLQELSRLPYLRKPVVLVLLMLLAKKLRMQVENPWLSNF